VIIGTLCGRVFHHHIIIIIIIIIIYLLQAVVASPQQLVYYNVSPLRGSVWVTRIGCGCFAAGISKVHTR